MTRLTILVLAAATAVFGFAPPAGAAETLRITEPPNPMTGTVTVPFSYTFTARPGTGTPPYRFRLHPDYGPLSLPTGLSLGENGVLSGTPTVFGTWIFRVMVIDGNSAASSTGQITFNTTVLPMALGPAPAATIPALVNYQHQFSGSGGMPPYTFSRTGSLPTGMTVGTDGRLVGVPHQSGTFTFTVRVEDFIRNSASSTFTLNVVPPVITGFPPAAITVGRPFSHTFTTTPGAIGSVTFSRLTGFLPTGLSLAPNGVLSGTPTALGTYNSVVLATFTVGSPSAATFEDYRQITITVVPAPTMAPTGPAPSTPAATTAGPSTGSVSASANASTSGTAGVTPSGSAQTAAPSGTTPVVDAGGPLDSSGRIGVAAWSCGLLTFLAGAALLVFWLVQRRRGESTGGQVS